MISIRWALSGILSLILLLAGCTHHTQAPPTPIPSKKHFPNWPNELNDFRFRWTAESSIDLVSGPAILLRAYLESYQIGEMTADPRNTYPGFQRAVPDVPSPDDDPVRWGLLPFQIKRLRPAIKSETKFWKGPFFGNEYFHILEINPITNGYRAYVCDGQYAIYHPANTSGRFTSVVTRIPENGRNLYSMALWRVEFGVNPDESMSAPPVTQPQEGLDPAPLGDVFNSWRITGASQDNSWGTAEHPEATPDDTDYLARRQQCFDRQPFDAVQREALYTGDHDSPPKTEPAAPGWPSRPS